MKKIIYISISLIFLLSFGCTEDKENNEVIKDKVEITKVSITPSELNLIINETYKLEAKYEPKEAEEKDMLWESKDETIISVNEFGVIKALAIGKTKVTATSSNGIIGSCEITVKKKTINVSSISLDVNKIEIDINQEQVLNANVLPYNADNKEIVWSCSDDKVLSINQTGLIIGLTEGNATVTVTTKDGNKTASCDVTVKQMEAPDSFTDERDNHVYKTVEIGNQVWMAENLAYLPSISTDKMSETEAKYYVYDNLSTDINEVKKSNNYIQYGVLYNWVAAMKSCPKGWHIPTNEEWKELEMFLGMSKEDADKKNDRGDIANKMKNITGWDPSDNASNESGLSVLPAGFRGSIYSHKGKRAMFWTGTEYESSNRGAYYRKIDELFNFVGYRYANKKDGYSIRCIKNKE